MNTERTVNYTSEQETQLQQLYQSGKTVSELASHFDKSERSIVAKLSRMGLYEPRTVRRSGPRVTKASLVKEIEEMLNLEGLETLEKADKTALASLAGAVQAITRSHSNLNN